MKIDQRLKLDGNLNRITEMNNAGIGVNTIAGVFQDNNINLSANDVTNLLKVIPTLTSKALPKSEAQKVINQQNNGGLQVAM